MRSQPSYLLEELVFGHLTHSGFSETARLAARDMMGGAREVSAFDVESVKRRREISDRIAAGDIDRCPSRLFRSRKPADSLVHSSKSTL